MAHDAGFETSPGEMGAQFQKMQQELATAQQELANETVEVTAGGGAVRIEMSGTQEIRKVTISQELMKENDPGTLEDLIALAVNQAIHESQVMAARRLGPIQNLIDLP